MNTETKDTAGAALAVKMLAELKEGQETLSDACSIHAEYRAPGTGQRNIVLEYMTAIQSPEDLASFAAVLSDFVAACVGGFVPDASTYAPSPN